jgi:hypothetical protein
MRRREINVMRTANSTDSRSTTVADVPFTNGTIRIQVDTWKKPVVDVTPQDSHTVDHVMASTATAAWGQIDKLNALIATRSNLTAVDNSGYATSRSMTVGDTTVRVRVSFRLNVGVPTYIVHPIAEAILGEAMTCALHVVDPNMAQVMKQDTVEKITAQMMSGFASMTFNLFADLNLFGGSNPDSSPETGETDEDTTKPKEA